MASAVQSFLKENVKFAYGGIGLPFAALDVKGILDSDNKFKAILKTMKDLVLIRVSLVGTFAAIGASIKALVKDTGSLDAALKRLSEVQHFQRVFTPLVGGAKAARKEVADLIQFASHTPFKFEGVASAAVTLQTSTRGQFVGEPALKKVGDAAATSGNSIEESARAVGSFYEALHNGDPINQSVEAMRQMGLISIMAATNIQRLAESGADATAMAGQLTSALSESRGGMKEFANDLDAVTTAREKAVEGAQVAFGAPFTEKEIQNTKNYTEAIVAITPALASAGNALSGFVGGVEGATSAFVKWIGKSGVGETAIKLLTTGLVALAAVFTAIGVAAIPGFIALIATLMVAVDAAIAGMVAWGVSMGVAATSMAALGTAMTVVANIAAGAAIAVPFIAAGLAVVALGVAVKNLIDHSRNLNRALAEEMAAHSQAIAAIHGHIAAIQTLADKYQAVSEAIQQTIKDQTELNNLRSKREALQKEIATSDPLIAARKKIDLAELNQRIEQQEKKIAIDRKTRQQAERTSAIAGPEREALIQLQTRRQLLLEEQRLEEQIAAQPGRGPELQRQRAGVLAERAREGRAGLEANERVALRRSAITTQSARGEVEVALAGDKEQLAKIENEKGKKDDRKRLKDQIAIKQGILDKIDAEILAAGLQAGQDTAIGLETRAQQLQHAINAKAEQDAGNQKVADREKELAGGAVAGPTTPAEILALQKRAGFKRQLEAQAPEAEVEARRKIVQAQEEERGRFVTELQIHIERGIVTAARQGPPGQKELLTDLRSFIGHFEDLRKIFPDPKAAQLAMEKVGTEIMNFPAEALKPVADSLTRVGGGGGVGGPTGDPRLMAQQRMLTLQGTANNYLAQIEANTAKGAQPAPEETTGSAAAPSEEPAAQGEAPTTPTTTAEQPSGVGAGGQGAAPPTPGETAAPAPEVPAAPAPQVAPSVAPPAQPASIPQAPAITPPAAPAVNLVPPAIPAPAAPAVIPQGPAIAPPAAPPSGIPDFVYRKPAPTPPSLTPAVAPPAAPAVNVAPPAVAPPAIPAALPQGPAIAPPAAPAMIPQGPAIAPPAAIQPSAAIQSRSIQPSAAIQSSAIQPSAAIQSSSIQPSAAIQSSSIQPSRGIQSGSIQPSAPIQSGIQATSIRVSMPPAAPALLAPAQPMGPSPGAPIPGGRTAGVGESQSLVNNTERNRLAFEKQFQTTAQPMVETGTGGPSMVGAEAVAARKAGIEHTGEESRAAELERQTQFSHAQVASQMVESFKAMGNGANAAPAVEAESIPVTASIPTKVPSAEETPMARTNMLLNNIFIQNKQSNEHLGVVAVNSADQGKSF